MNNIRHTARSALACLTALPLVLATAATEAAPWTSVGASGLIDNNDLSLYVTDNTTGLLTFAGGSRIGALNLKYNVVNVDAFLVNSLQVRFRDNGDAARVVLQLRRYNINTGVTSAPLATFDSNTYSPSSAFQTRFVCFSHGFDFNNYAYFINASITKTTPAAGAPTGAPAIGAMKLGVENCVS